MAKISTDRAIGGQTQFPLPIHDKTATAKVNGTDAAIASQNEQSVTLAVPAAQDDVVAITFTPIDEYGQGRTEVFTPADGGTVSPTSLCGYARVTPDADLGTLTINFPPNPGVNLVGKIQVFTVFTSKTIASITWSGGTVIGAPVALVAGQEISFTFSPDTGKWYKQP